MMSALRRASALRRLPARTGDVGSAQDVLPPLAGRAPLLSRALSLPHLTAVRQFSDKLDRATTMIKEGEVLVEKGKLISRHLTTGVKDSTKERLRQFKSGLSDIVRVQFQNAGVNRVGWMRISMQSLGFLVIGGIFIQVGGSYMLERFKPHMRAIAKKAIDKAEEKGKKVARSAESRATAQKFIDQAVSNFSFLGFFFGRKEKEQPKKK